MGTGQKIALGCGSIVLAGAALAAGTCGLLTYWAKGKAEGVVSDFGEMAKKASAVTEEIERWEQKANANPYDPPADGVIPEPRLLKFLEARKQVHAVYEARRADLEAIEKKPASSSDKLTPSELWNAGGQLADAFGALKLAQAKALAEVGMSEAEYHAIQLAVAPVFLLSGIGVFLGVLTNRLARIVDRARKVEEGLHLARATDPDAVRDMLRVAARRAHYINVSVTLGTIAALLVSLVVALLFASTFVPLDLAASVAILFVLAMTALVGALVAFLVEVRIAIAALRIGTP